MLAELPLRFAGRDVEGTDGARGVIAVKRALASTEKARAGLLVRVEDPLIGDLPKSQRRAETPCDNENKTSHSSPLMLLR